MKLLSVIENYNKIINVDNDFCLLASDKLNIIKDQLLQCDEFENLNELNIISSPFGENEFNLIYETQSIIINDDTKFSDILYLYSLSLSPVIDETTGQRNVFLRGVWGTITSKEYSSTHNVSNLNFNPDTLKHRIIFYSRYHTVNDEISVSLARKFIPIEYVDKLNEQFGDLHLITEEEVDAFCKENNIPNL